MRRALLAAPPEVSTAARCVEVFCPRQAPHLASIAKEFESVIAGKLETVLGDPENLARFAAGAVDAREAREAFDSIPTGISPSAGEPVKDIS